MKTDDTLTIVDAQECYYCAWHTAYYPNNIIYVFEDKSYYIMPDSINTFEWVKLTNVELINNED